MGKPIPLAQVERNQTAEHKPLAQLEWDQMAQRPLAGQDQMTQRPQAQKDLMVWRPLAEKEQTGTVQGTQQAQNPMPGPCRLHVNQQCGSVARGIRKLADAGGLDGSAEHPTDAGVCIGFRASEGPELAEATKSVSRSEFLSLGKPVK